ncbi:AraC family transcriptional regulator [Tateyamaria omphalii]|uniref:AraC family transcriptional regulator n=1 Tax=Tateyamaria omphalii TaxID=299262 RepID=UPI001C9934A3|nr:AraC family transcriptional regulator [Tateyamaria omphalii]MBY5935116.1 AraC family transcriptional regulator [Tateyamaria omphalii]
MSHLIPYEELPTWVPGKTLLSSDGMGWKQVGLRSYRYDGQDVVVPAMRDFMLVSYRHGTTPMQRRFDGQWTRETLGPGEASLLTRSQRAHWTWDEQIDVVHLYLSSTLVTEVASEVMDCAVSEVTLNDVLRTDDTTMAQAVRSITQEVETGGLGGALFVESMSRALIIHLLRRYASIKLPAAKPGGALSPRQVTRIKAFVHAMLSERIDLKTMAAAVGLPPCVFARYFRKSFGRPPYAYVMDRRLEMARRLLARSAMPIKAVAADCGFSDQSHLTRVFSARYGETPAVFRRRAH